ncbi:hypothetical protein Dsin_013899 [Dipteronia sinensis]|uniref:Uncharacterized protein n=1 Tax=Dipteronia sinensis TaxID=43782 RepID=A0AAE0AM29_9ROSI|nr:hypothetical protein Dsin_013899 [Dipteronia sinensis]
MLSDKIKQPLVGLPNVRFVLPDSYQRVKKNDYGGEPFINGQAVPYDPKYHKDFIRNLARASARARANKRNRRNDQPICFDRSGKYEIRRENMQTDPPLPGGGITPDAGWSSSTLAWNMQQKNESANTELLNNYGYW